MMARRYAVALLSLSLASCATIGPTTVVRDRIDYASAIGNSWKEQTLLNIVKLRYADMPIFLEIAQVIAGYQLQGTIGANFTAGNFTAGIVGPVAAGGGAVAAGTYTDRPTVIYAPLTGVDFLRSLMTPVPPSAVLFVLQSGYDAERIMRITLDSVNGLENRSYRLQRPADPKFLRVIELMREGQLAGAVQIRIERHRQGPESTVIAFGPSKDPEIAAKGRELRGLLRLKQNLREINVYYGGYSGKDNEIDMQTRSMLQIMQEFAAMVQVPEADITAGRASPGLAAAQGGPPQAGALINILSGNSAPKDAYVAVNYRGRWFWVSDGDIRSKLTFASLMLLFSVSETGVRGAATVVTIPANQ